MSLDFLTGRGAAARRIAHLYPTVSVRLVPVNVLFRIPLRVCSASPARTTIFAELWLAQIVSEIGDWFYTLAIYSLLLDLTGRASSVALALVLQVLPQTFVGPLAGAINDRLSRRQVMIFADLMRMIIVASMLLVRSARICLGDLSAALSSRR